MKIKYLLLSLVIITFTACIDEDLEAPGGAEAVEITSGDADFSRVVAMGATLTAGYTDGALFHQGQMNSYPNIMAGVMAHAGGGEFTQPYMNDNIGGLLVGGMQFQGPRLYFDGARPATLPGTPTTEATNVMPGPYSNMAIPGCNAIHMLAPGYGSMAALMQGLANPYFVRMASNDNAQVITDVIGQSPTFVSILSGFSDALASATDGATSVSMGSVAEFQFAFGTTMGALGQMVPNGVVSNIPDVTNNPFFNLVGHDVVPLDAGTAGMLNGAFAPYNGGLLLAQSFGFLTADEVAARTIVFAEGNNALVIDDSDLTNLLALGLPSYRQATADDKILLSTAAIIGTLVGGNPMMINGVSVPLDDTRVLTASEAAEIQTTIAGYNATISAIANQSGWAMFDMHAFIETINSVGVTSGDLHLTGDLVFGGFYSLDGIHPTARGNAVIANAMMEAIDSHYGSNLSDAAVYAGDYPTNYPPDM